MPVLCIPGNHDPGNLLAERLTAAPFVTDAPIVAGNWSLIGMDSTVTGRAGGLLGDAELDRTRTLIDSAQQDFIALCLHHPPIRLRSRWLDGVGLDDSDRLLALLEEYDSIRLVLFGHAHQAAEAVHANARILGTPSTCRQFKPKSDEFALDNRPPAYRRITLNDDGSTLSDLVWVA